MKTKHIQIVSALIWAAAMIACSFVLRDSAANEHVVNILIVGATMHFLLLSHEFARTYAASKKDKGRVT